MAIVVEDGTGKADAEAYATVAAYKAHCDARGITYGTDAAIEILLRKGADYMLQAYRLRWSGVRASTTQALDWPRFEVPVRDGPSSYGTTASYYASDAVPAPVIRANIELAIRAASTDLAPDLEQAVKRERVGPLEVEYQDGTNATPRFTAIDDMLKPFFSAMGGARVTRA